MESPPDFDVWVRLEPGSLAPVVRWFRETRHWTLAQALAHARYWVEKGSGWVRLHASLGWEDVTALVKSPPPFVLEGSARVTEGFYSPDDCRHHCEVHPLDHGSEPCPVCEGRYITRVRRGVRYAVTPDSGA